MTIKRRRSDDGHELIKAKTLVPRHTITCTVNSVTKVHTQNHPLDRQQATITTAVGKPLINDDVDPATPPLFTCFSRLPSELRALIWRDAYVDHLDVQPSVCIYHGGTIPVGEEDDGGKPPRAGQASRGVRFNYARPIVHPESGLLETVCREARAVCMVQRGVKTSLAKGERKQSPGTGPVTTSDHLPSRAFNTEIDTLYIDRQKRHGDGSTILFYLGDRTQWARHVRHLAVPFSLARDIARQPGLLRHFKSLKSISLVFPTSSEHQELDRQVMFWSSPAIPISTPARRIRLRTLTRRELASILVEDDPRRPSSTLAARSWAHDGESIRDFMEYLKTSIYKRTRWTDSLNNDMRNFYWSDDGVFKFDMQGCAFA